MEDLIKGFAKGSGLSWRVGATRGSYSGPVAEVYVDKEWLHVTTDDYEGAAMLNIEALPHLIKALKEINKNLKSAHKRG